MTEQSGTSKLNTYLTGIKQEASLSWANSWSGPANAKLWTCICKIHGVERGRGVSQRQSDAKNIAADAALAYLTSASAGGST